MYFVDLRSCAQSPDKNAMKLTCESRDVKLDHVEFQNKAEMSSPQPEQQQRSHTSLADVMARILGASDQQAAKVTSAPSLCGAVVVYVYIGFLVAAWFQLNGFVSAYVTLMSFTGWCSVCSK